MMTDRDSQRISLAGYLVCVCVRVQAVCACGSEEGAKQTEKRNTDGETRGEMHTVR